MSTVLLKQSILHTLSLSDSILATPFSDYKGDGNDSELIYLFFSTEEIDIITKKVQGHKADSKLRNGGAYILKELKYVESFKEGLLAHIDNIREALKPKERSRQSLEDALNAQERKIIDNIRHSFNKLDTKTLRTLARAQVGDIEENYTNEELPLLLAYKQVTGKIIEEGSVFI